MEVLQMWLQVQPQRFPGCQSQQWWAKDIRLDWPTVMFDDFLQQLVRLISYYEKQANTLNNQFSSLFTREDDWWSPTICGNKPDITMSPAGVRKLLRQLQPYKAMEPDQIPTKLLKVGAEELTPLFSVPTLFNIHQRVQKYAQLAKNIVLYIAPTGSKNAFVRLCLQGLVTCF